MKTGHDSDPSRALIRLVNRLLPIILLAGCPVLAQKPAPWFRDFVGLCGHTVNFKPDLYSPVCAWVRDYHPVPWDLGKDTSVLPEWPFAKNKVSWEKVYSSWRQRGLQINVCLQIDEMKDAWRDMEADARAYAGGFARAFGPGGRWPLVESVEFGNEPGLYADDAYLKLFDAMARGVREASPKLKIVTCNVEAGPSDRYWKSASLFKDRAELYDVLQIHRYAIEKGWPEWRRTYPENAKVPFLSSIRALLDWRDANAPGKEVWVTEFGWDCSTKKPDPNGDMARWVDSTDEDQARYLVRSFFLLASMGVDRAFVYFFNDDDKPGFHASSGITRNYQPKPSYHAIAWMLRSLRDHRFGKVLRSSMEDGYVMEFTPENPEGDIIWAAWHPTRHDAPGHLPAGPGRFVKAEIMPLSANAAGSLDLAAASVLHIEPVLIWWRK